MVRTKSPKLKVHFNKVRPSKTLPDQSMTIKELVRRFVKGLPIEGGNAPKVYINVDDLDLEKLGRLDPTDKAFEAQNMAAENATIYDRIKATREAQAQHEAQKREEQVAKTAAETAGIVKP